jgi:hypothetical protein
MYLILYWIFDSRLWKVEVNIKNYKCPDLSGEWDCEGRGENKEGDVFSWNAKINIFQSWDKVHIRLQTSQSGSDSIAALNNI